MENKAKFTAKNLLFRLHRSIPRRGRKRLEDGSYQFVPIKDLGIGDTIVSFTGEKLIVDGIVIEGEGACEESLVTGESIPISKSLGSRVIGGSLLQSGWLACRMTASAEESALHKIISMVEQQIDHKASYVRLADRIVRWFVPVVVAIAIITGISCMIFGVMDASQTITETAWMRAIAILLISCPCAIGIAAPLAESNLINSLAQLGVLVRNRGCLSLLGRETVIVFDKTGTVTEGQFRLLAGLEHLSEEKLRVLKGIASQSLHPIAHAIAKAIEGVPMQFDKIEEFAGNGLRGVIGEHIYCLGSSEFFKQLGIALPERFASTHKGIISEVFFAINGVFITKLELGDRIREGIKELLKALSPAKTILLSGDSALSVEQVAKECGFHEWKSQSTPLHKRDFVDQLRHQGEIVCMIGDGINDAPALTGANIGISVVSASDISIQVSDLLLTTDKLAVLPKIRSLAKKGQHITKQNLFWAFFYNVIGIGLAAFGVLSPIFSAFAMVTSSLIVLFNAKRINGAVLR